MLRVAKKFKKNLKIILRIAIFCFCALLTLWRAWLCFERYFARPQSINLDIVESSKSNLPDITFCIKTSPFNESILGECGIQNYTAEWTSQLCPDGDRVSNLIQIPSEMFIKKALGAFRSPFRTEKLNVTALPKIRKNCFTITLEKPYDRIFIQFTNDVWKVYIHAMGEFNNVLINGVSIDPKVDINLDYEIVIKKSTRTEQCKVSLIKKKNHFYEPKQKFVKSQFATFSSYIVQNHVNLTNYFHFTI